MILSAWNAYAKEAGEVIAPPTQGLSIVGFHAVKKARYRGVSLKTTMCTELVVNPNRPISDMLRKWIKENMTTLHSWVTKCHALKGSSSTRVITPVVEIERRKPNTVWQDESFWINITAPSVYAFDVYCYIGCDKCGRRANLPPNTTYKCQHCTAAQSVTTLRVSFQFFVTDGEGSVRVIAFGKEAEKVLAATTEDLHRQKNNDDQAELDATLSAVEDKNMLLQIVPSSALTPSYVLKWVVRAVEATTVVKKEPDDLQIEYDTSQAEGISPDEENFLQVEHEE